MSDYLIAEPPLLVLPTLAKSIGLNEAIMLQQCHYWMLRSPHGRDGRTWFWKRQEDWQAEFPFWSKATIKRIAKSLRESKLLDTEHFNAKDWDHKTWWSINYKEFARLEARIKADLPRLAQIDPIEEPGPAPADRLNLSQSKRSTRARRLAQDDPISKETNTTSETTAAEGTAAAFASLLDAGVAEATAQDLIAKYGADRAKAVAADPACHAARNPAGWIVSALKAGYGGSPAATDTKKPAAPPPPKVDPDDAAIAAAHKEAAATLEAVSDEEFSAWKARLAEAFPEEANRIRRMGRSNGRLASMLVDGLCDPPAAPTPAKKAKAAKKTAKRPRRPKRPG